jgi:hypothetical protein
MNKTIRFKQARMRDHSDLHQPQCSKRHKIDVLGTISLQVVEKGKRIHTIVAVVSMNVDQTIFGWKDLMAMGVISLDWPAMPRQETEGRILAADKDE